MTAYTKQMPESLPEQIRIEELALRRLIEKHLNGMINWGRAKLGVFPFDAQIQRYGDVYQVVIKVVYQPLPSNTEVYYKRMEPLEAK